MTIEEMEDFNLIVWALERKYRPLEEIPAYRALFSGRRQQIKECPQDFAENLRLLAKKAFPQESAQTRESRVVDKFIEGLQDKDSKKHVVFQHPTSMTMAVSIALEWEAFEEAQKVSGVCKQKDRDRALVVQQTVNDNQTKYMA